MKKKGKLSTGKKVAIILISVFAAILCALFITNLFFPLKYTTAYMVKANPSPQDGIYYHCLDVGQADCTIAELPDGKVMLIDGGDGAYVNTLKILKTLNSLGVDKIDYMICTSVNEEHCGGLEEIISRKNVDIIYCPYSKDVYINDSYYKFYTAATSCGAQVITSQYGTGAEGGEGDTEYFFTFLSPSVADNPQSEYALLNDDPSDENKDNASAVLWIECGGCGTFYAGDVQTSVLDAIAESYTLVSRTGGAYYSYGSHKVDFSKCCFYKVANHSNYTSFSTSLYSLLSPDISVISVGENNADDCPSVYVISELYSYGEVYLTMYQGDVTVKACSGGASIA